MALRVASRTVAATRRALRATATPQPWRAPPAWVTMPGRRRTLSSASADLALVDLQADDSIAAEQLGEACRHVGFMQVVNHGVDTATLEALFEHSRRLFDLPEHVKRVYLATSENGNRGWTPMGAETLDPANQTEGDTKEGWYVGLATPVPESPQSIAFAARHAAGGEGWISDHVLCAPNVWPTEAEVPGFRDVALQYIDTVCDIGRRVNRLVAMALGAPPTSFDQAFQTPLAALRLLHYAAVPSDADNGLLGAGAHCDYGQLTFLATDGSPGLQVEDPDAGVWIDVQAQPGAFVVNVGDMLARWSNDEFRSTRHRVVLPPGTGERYSAALFFEPEFYTKVKPLPSCCIDHPAQYDEVTSGEYLLSKYMATHDNF